MLTVEGIHHWFHSFQDEIENFLMLFKLSVETLKKRFAKETDTLTSKLISQFQLHKLSN